MRVGRFGDVDDVRATEILGAIYEGYLADVAFSTVGTARRRLVNDIDRSASPIFYEDCDLAALSMTNVPEGGPVDLAASVGPW